jgi:hypothetical protein
VNLTILETLRNGRMVHKQNPSLHCLSPISRIPNRAREIKKSIPSHLPPSYWLLFKEEQVKAIRSIRDLKRSCNPGQAPMVHTYNPSYSGGRAQEDCGSKSAWANCSQDPILKKPFPRKGWWSGSRCRP